MKVIKIIRDSIRKNPEYDLNGMVQNIPSHQEITGTCFGEIPDSIKDKVVVISQEISEDGIHKYGFHFNGSVSDIIKDERISWSITQNYDDFVSHSAPQYLYEYENEPVKCCECGNMVPVAKIESDYQDDVYIQFCPICHESNTFEYRLERIEEVINEGFNI
jgi:hypothetical protein